MIRRVRCLFTGLVQGVGFRPFIYRIATRCSLSGFVQNTRDGVIVEMEGPAEAREKFLQQTKDNLPPLAEIAEITITEIDVRNEKTFRILESFADGKKDVHSAPDSATCDACLEELFNPADRRYRYPFINCTNCGPRLTIVKEVPYDRCNTSLSCFPLCPQCKKEYEDPSDRRFHAEPNACPACGPQLRFFSEDGQEPAVRDPVLEAVEKLKAGAILALKGLGGFHLCVDAANDDAVKRLRVRKHREEKPLALMVKDVDAAVKIAEISRKEKAMLLSPQRPIVLLKKKDSPVLSPFISPGMPNLGIMLPYTPLHHLILEKHFNALVMTSGNKTDEPICIGNREARERLRGIADFFLVHNRDILVRCDDSLMMVSGERPCMLRRSRGFVPNPLMLKETLPDVLALGPHLKATICIVKGNRAFLSPHIGDMETPQARDFFHETIAFLQKITECAPKIIAADLHPGYYSTAIAESTKNMRVVNVQHHHAHIVSCMAENRLTGKVIGLAMDGTGYGLDKQIWGGEFLVADETAFTRSGHIKYFQLPGGEKAIHEPWRIGVSLLHEAYDGAWEKRADTLNLVPQKNNYAMMTAIMERKLNSPSTSSLGRLFDGVAAILGLRQKVGFEGQAAMELEGLARGTAGMLLPYAIDREGAMLLLNPFPAIKSIAEQCVSGRSAEELASAFHYTLQHAFIAMAEKIRSATGLNRVVLSGGCFQNRVLLEGCITGMLHEGFEVFTHHLVPSNDGGISLGQAVCAGAQIRQG
ncbi:MAG: carbamoyltransferase HypF [Pseudomonadota bacterium]